MTVRSERIDDGEDEHRYFNNAYCGCEDREREQSIAQEQDDDDDD